jgi:hypothetical protein
MSFRVDDATLFPFPSDSSDTEITTLPEHAASRLVPELTVIWQHYLMTAEARPFRFYVESWFCDHDRFPRTVRGREVLLPPDPDTWRQALLDKWRDMIDPQADTLIYVVSPNPIGGPSEVLAHVLLAQHQHRGFVSALITTMAPGDDIWDPPRVALKLPSVVDKGLLIQESGLFMFCPPFMPDTICTATYGSQPVVQDALRDAHSGDGFLCVAETIPTSVTEITAGTDSLADIDHLFHTLGRVVTTLVQSVVGAIHSFPQWAQQVDALQSDISTTLASLETCIAHSRSLPQPSPLMPTATHEQVEFVPSSLGGLVQPFRALPGPDGIGSAQGSSDLSPELVKCLKQQFESRDTLHVHVWYVDSLRHPVCYQSRLAALSRSLSTWFDALVLPWNPERWPHADVHFVPLCVPVEALLPETHVHVIMFQHPLPGLMPALVVNELSSSMHSLCCCAVFVPIELTAPSLRSVIDRAFPHCSDRDVFAYSLHCGDRPWHPDLSGGQHAVVIRLAPAHSSSVSHVDSDECFGYRLRAAIETVAPCPKDICMLGEGVPDAPVSVPCPGFPVTLVLDAVLPKSRHAP